MPRTRQAFCGLILLHASELCGVQPGQVSAASPVDIQMQGVRLHLDGSTVLEVSRLRGRMLPVHRGQPVTFDDPNSFRILIDSGDVAVTAQTLSDLLNRRVFYETDAPLRKISIAAEGGRVRGTGVLHRKIDIPFSVEGSLDVSASGEVRLHAEKVAAAHVPVKGLLHLFGADLSALINVKSDRGVRIDGDDILLDPARMLPPPKMEGDLKKVRVDGDRIVFSFGPRRMPDLRPPLPAASYIYHHGGILRFGKLTMTGSDLELVNNPPRAPFDFSLPDYNRQLVAGYSKNTPARGLLVFMPDFAALAPPARGDHRKE